MDYEGRICRSPFERGAFMLPVMVGCTHNKCKFCNLFKDLKFRVLPFEQVKSEIDSVAKQKGNPERVFLGDGNAFSLKTKQLLEICNYVMKSFSNCREINMDATVTSILSKTDEELNQLYKAGVRHLYIGIESGLDDVLEFMVKDHNQEQAKVAIARMFEAGLIFDAHIMSGVSGCGRGIENAIALAKFFNEFPPKNICNFDMFVSSHADLWIDYKLGKFEPEDAIERFEEEITLIENLDESHEIHYDGLFEKPPIRFIGTLPQDKDKLINRFKSEIEKIEDEEPIYSIFE